MKNSILICITLIGSFFSVNALAQTGVSIDMTYGAEAGISKNGVTGLRFDEVDGDPYLYDTWLPGDAKLTDGKLYKDMLLKFDLINNRLIFKYNPTDSAQAFAIPVVEFVLHVPEINGSMHFVNGFAPADGGTDKTFYWVMVDGQIKLLKRVKKRIQSGNTDMNVNIVKRTIVESTGYYITKGDTPVMIKNDKKSVLSALSDQAPALQQFIADNRLDLKKDADLIRLIDHYNQIKKS